MTLLTTSVFWRAALWLVFVVLVGLGQVLPPFGRSAEASGSAARIMWQGGSWYLQGANVPWYNWACDFGCGANGGVSTPTVRAAISDRFVTLRAAGAHAARWWAFEGDAWQITRAAAGAPAGLNPAVYADFDAALQLADQYDLYYDFVLFSGPSALPSVWLSDGTQRAKLASTLAPLFARYKGNPRILSWEVFNEPDFDVWNGKVALADLQATVKAVVDTVHANSPAYVTVGMGFADGLPMVQGLGLDYYQAHWFDYMSDGTYCMRCNSSDYYRSLWSLDAPLVVGEFYAGPDVDALQRYEDFYAKGYAGAWSWSLFPEKTFDRLAIDLAAMRTFTSRHADLGPRASTPTTTPTPDLPPTAALSVSCAGLTCTLDARASSDDRGITSYRWDCGVAPNCGGSGPVVTATYPHAGPRTVTLTVTDSNGQINSVTQTVLVS